MSKYKAKFTPALQKEFPYMKMKTEKDVLCTICHSTINISNRGRSAINDHLKTIKHIKGTQTISNEKSSTSNLRRQMRSKHTLEFKSFEEQQQTNEQDSSSDYDPEMVNIKEELNSSDEENPFLNSDYELEYTPPLKKKKGKIEFPSSSTSTLCGKKPISVELNSLILKFFIEFDLPLAAIKSQNLRNLFEKLNPSYAEVMPDEKSLKIALDNVYQSALDEVRMKKTQNFSLLLSRELKDNRRLINVHAKPMFKPPIFFSQTASKEGNFDDDDFDKLVDDVENQFHCKIVSVVEDCLSDKVLVKPELKDCTTKCQQQLLESIASSASDSHLKAQVENILKTLNEDYSNDKNLWKREMETYKSFLDKLDMLKLRALDQGGLIDDSIHLRLGEESFLNKVEETYKNLKRILHVNNESNLMSDAMNNWIDIQNETSLLSPESEAYKQIFSITNLAAHVFDPKYKDRKLSSNQRQLIRFFVSKRLKNKEEFEKFDEYLEGSGFFNDNELIGLEAQAFWMMMKGYCKNLSNLATIFASLPATTKSDEFHGKRETTVDTETLRKIALIKFTLN